MKIKTDAIILDVDGTLWDSTELVAKAWTSTAHDNGFPERIVTADELKEQFGRPMDEIANNIFPGLDENRLDGILKSCVKYENEVLHNDPCDMCFPGVVLTIRSLSKRIPVCIVSNSQSGYIELFMDKTGTADCITDHICFGDNGLLKHENIALVVKRNGFKNAVYVGDIRPDEEASRKAGVGFIHASYGFGTAESPDASISCFPELEDIIEIDFQGQKELSEYSIRFLIKQALAARLNSYSPYSGFRVGAALLSADGRIFTGCNVENASYGATNCAERTAAFKAVSEGERRFCAIAIVGGTDEKMGIADPCGVCRQVLREFSVPEDFTVIVARSVDEYNKYTLAELLPHSFGPDFKDI